MPLTQPWNTSDCMCSELDDLEWIDFAEKDVGNALRRGACQYGGQYSYMTPT